MVKPKKRKPTKKGPQVVKLYTEDKKVVPVLVPAPYVPVLLASPPVIRKVEYVAPLEETGWTKFWRLFFN
jgi:hypothetical protein